MQTFFIVGCPRSGTTLLQQALNRHPAVVIPPETKFFFFLLGRSLRFQRRQVDQINADLKIALPLPNRRIATPLQGRAVFEQMRDQYLARLGRSHITHFGEKSPEHLRRLPQIRQLFPAARILLVYRDGRDVALSLTRVPWMHHDLYVNFAIWLYYQRLQRQAERARLPNLLCVRYEDLVSNPEAILAEVQQFLGLPIRKEVACGAGNCEGVPEWEYAWKARAWESIIPSRVGQWRTELSGEQIALLERWGRQALRCRGYQLQSDGRHRLPALFFPVLAAQIAWWRVKKWLGPLP